MAVGRGFRRSFGLLLSVAVLTGPAFAADGESPWQSIRESTLGGAETERVLLTREHRTLLLDLETLQAILSRAPMEGTAPAEATVLALPMPDGRLSRFEIEESPIMVPELAAQFPEIRTYRGRGLDDPTATTRFDRTPEGFHAMVLRASGTVFLDPYRKGDVHHYVSYYKKDYRRRTPAEFRCSVTGEDVDPEALGPELQRELGSAPLGPAGSVKRTYLLALAATHQYSQFQIGRGVTPLSAMTTTMNRVNGIYENEVAVHMNFVSNESLIIYTDAANDPYSNGDGVAMLTQNQTNLDSVIGSANYDVGHVFSTGGGGVARIRCVCGVGIKAMGVTGSSSPVGDGFDVDYVAHEMGHQFGANHTFNASNGTACNSSNRNSATAYEPGSGSTIMSYSGICGSENLQNNSDDYFHGKSLDEINAYLSTGGGSSCITTSPSGNNPPSINAGSNYTIPRQTPFALTASGSDLDGDTLTYCWEEFDLGAASPPDTDATGARPILRSFSPTTSPTRTFPKLANVLSGTSSFGESLPTIGRTMTFRVTARDNHGGAGGTNSDQATVTVAAGTGPFVVTSPGTGAAWGIGTNQTVGWNVAGTTGFCSTVDILLSTDGGSTFPTALASTTANDGSQTIVVPNATTTSARVKVQCSTSVFFDISNPSFSILPSLSIADATPVIEGNTGTTPAAFVVTLAPAAGQTVTVHYATASGTAVAGTDFVAASGTLTFAPGATTQTVTVQVKGDLSYENNETFYVNLSSPVNAGIQDGQGAGTILNDGVNDDPVPSISIADASVVEGNSGVRNMLFKVTLAPASGVAANVSYATANGTAVAGTDFTGTTGTLTFGPGVTTLNVAVPVLGDTACEANKTFDVNLTGSTLATIVDNNAAGTILDDDGAGTFMFGAANYTVSEAATAAVIKVARINGLGGGATVSYAVSDGSATLGADYGSTTPIMGTLTFAAYQTYTTFTVPIVRDTNDEPNEAALLKLSNPTGCFAALGAPSTSVLTITDNDTAGKLAFSAAAYTVNEAATATITVRRTGGLSGPLTVGYSTSDGTASATSDYTGTTGTLTFAPGVAAATFQVATLDDSTTEGNETVNLTLDPPTGGATLGTLSTATLTITESNPSVQFTAATYKVAESSKLAAIAVRRTGSLASTLTVQYATSNGSGVAGTDYTLSTGTLTFAPGVALRAFTVGILNDNAVAGNKTVNLTLSNPMLGGVPGNYLGTAAGAPTAGTALLTITDLTELVQFSLATYKVGEASAAAVIAVKRTGSLVGTVTVNYAANNTVSTPAATPTVDYTPVSGTLTFGPGVAVRAFSVPILPDTAPEGTEKVDLTLSAPSGLALGPQQTSVLNIIDNEPTVQFSLAKYGVYEYATKATITVRRTGSAAGTAMVDFATSDGTAKVTDGDYTATSGTLTFLNGVTAKTFTVPINNDTVDEPGETVNLTLTERLGDVHLGTPSTAVLTILDNDLAGKVQFGAPAYSVAEPASSGSVTLTVTRTGGTGSGATVAYATSDGTAVAPTDYATTTGTLTFGLGETTKTFSVQVLNDAATTPNKFLNLALSSPGGGLVLGKQPTAALWIVE